jgi:retinol dehydrogenase-13
MKLPEELQFIQNNRLPQQATNARIDGKICIITGATSGIGYEAAQRCAKGGGDIIMVCRNPEKGTAVQKELIADYGVSVDCFIADFQRLAEVEAVARQIQLKYPKIDVLINNAGVFNRRRKLTPDGNEVTFGVIHLASYLLTKLLIENLKRSAPSRIIFINSEAHRFGWLNLKDIDWRKRIYIGLQAYGAANIAKIHTSMWLADKLIGSGVTVNVMHPGAVRTNIGMNNGLFYRLYSKYILRWFLSKPTSSAEAIYYLAADPGMAKVTGKYFNQTIEEKPAWYSVKSKMQQPVLELTEELVRPYLKEDQ